MTPSIPQVHSPNAADDFPWVWVSLREIQALWEGAPQLSTRRAPGGDPTGGHAWPFPVGRMEGPVGFGGGAPQSTGGAELPMGNPAPGAGRRSMEVGWMR